MVLWLVLAVLTAVAIAALLWPLARGSDSVPAAPSGDLAVYQDQLTELIRDQERGLISAKDVKAARTEVGRRLLRAADASAAQTSSAAAPDGEKRRGIATTVAAIAIPLLALALYLPLGAPHLPGRPYAALPRVSDAQASIADLIAKVEARLREHPEDGEGWDVIAPVYLRLGRFEDASDAYRRSLALKGETPLRLMGLAEAMVAARNGIVSEEARQLLEKVVGLVPQHVGARFLLALAKEQDGKLADAAADYRALLAAAPKDAPWRANVEGRLAIALGGGKRPPEEKGPDAEQVEAAKNMTPEQRTAMISSMVEGLAQRLKQDGRDLNGWLRLARAYSVLGKPEQARAALGRARTMFASDAKAIEEIAATEKSLGL